MVRLTRRSGTRRSLECALEVANGLVDDDMPPGAIDFDLYKSDAGEYRVRMRFVYETLSQFTGKGKISGGIVSMPISFAGCSGTDCSVPLAKFASIADGLNTKGFVQKQWTANTSDPVALAPLSDPAWSMCK